VPNGIKRWNRRLLAVILENVSAKKCPLSIRKKTLYCC
jgi:hypothetical protein